MVAPHGLWLISGPASCYTYKEAILQVVLWKLTLTHVDKLI
jgi:hypothetical protein